MKIIQNPTIDSWEQILTRPLLNDDSLTEKVKMVLNDVRMVGDTALKKYTKLFDGIELENFCVSTAEITAAEENVSLELKSAIKTAAKNIQLFHEKQISPVEVVETMPGVKCWRQSVGIEKVGLYIPGGSAPLFSTILMLGIPAIIAGCKQIILCSPPDKNGQLNPAILYTANLVGITNIYKIGGVQAIAAMAYGTDSVPKVHKIFGPGNQYVTCAKKLIQMEGIAIDMPAGPSEVCVIADEDANPEFVAADLLSQAEHGIDSQVLLLSTNESVVNRIMQELDKQLLTLPRKDIAIKSLENSKAIILNDWNEVVNLVNDYAAEHLIIACKNDEEIAAQIMNAGSIFLGHYSPESIGDYASGTNHTLPTNGFAKAYSGVSVDSFVKKITYQKITKTGLKNIGNVVELMAAAEGLDAHKRAVSVRLKSME